MWKEKAYMVAYELSDMLIQLFIANLLWILCNSPLIILGIQLRLATSIESYFILLPLLTLGLPLFFFPTTQALFCVMRDSVLQRPSATIKDFFSYLKNNYKETLQLGILVTGTLVGLCAAAYYSWFNSLILFTMVLIALFFLMVMTLQLFSFQAHFDMPLLWKLNRCRQLVFARPVYSIGAFLLIAVLNYAGTEISIALFVCIIPAASIFAATLLFYYQYKRITTKSKVMDYHQ